MWISIQITMTAHHQRVSIAIRALALLARSNEPLTRGEVRTALGLPPDVAIDSRLRELRKPAYGAFDLRVEHHGNEYRYFLPAEECVRARQWLTSERGA